MNLQIGIDFNAFRHMLTHALNNKEVRDQIIAQLNTSNEIPANCSLLVDLNLTAIYQTILSLTDDPGFIIALYNLHDESDLSLGSSILIQRKSVLETNPYFLTTRIARDQRGFKLSVLPHSKAWQVNETVGQFEQQKNLRKFNGSTTSVSGQYDITPSHLPYLDPIAACKAIDLGTGEEPVDFKIMLDELKKSIHIARLMGDAVYIGNIYWHAKLESDGQLKQHMAINITEKWTPINLWDFIVFSAERKKQVIKSDIEYIDVDLSQDAVYKAAVQKITLRFVIDLLLCLSKLHGFEMIHNDLKPHNIVLFIDEAGKVRVKLIDFNLSQPIQPQPPPQHMPVHPMLQPLATVSYAAPEVVAFTLETAEEQIFYIDLLNSTRRLKASAANSAVEVDNFCYASYGRELFFRFKDELTQKFDLQQDITHDVFSLGVVLYMLITGCYPTDIKDETKSALDVVKYMRVNNAYTRYPEYKDLLDGMLDYRKQNRFTLTEALEAANKIYATPAPVPAPPRRSVRLAMGN